jgi:RimJ/RimL family protein N-acetyltransferase
VSPEITTERLHLKLPTIDDFEARVAILQEPAVYKYLGGMPFNRHDVWSRILSQIGHWHVYGFGYWCLWERSSGQHVGNLGFGVLERGVVPDFGTAPELGYILGTQFQGKGYASEAAQAAHDWLYAKMGQIRTVAMISPSNDTSIRLAHRFGYSQYALSTFKNEPIALFERHG